MVALNTARSGIPLQLPVTSRPVAQNAPVAVYQQALGASARSAAQTYPVRRCRPAEPAAHQHDPRHENGPGCRDC